MKNRLSFLLFTLLLTVAPLLAQQTEKTLVKSFNLNGHNSVQLEMDGSSVTMTTWNEPQMRIQMTITLQNGSETMLKSLVTAGRYNLNGQEKDGNYSIAAPGLERQIKLSGGQLLGESIKYSVMIPKGVSVTTRQAANTTEGASTSTF